jgi:hypothetical protein
LKEGDRPTSFQPLEAAFERKEKKKTKKRRGI